ncbi:hypothetical protein E2C11_21985 [Streptomyces lavendulae]|nr:hypothetical protein [Streptomyces lavendulae]TXJ76435.1 hypothetical protein E2C11_21985 [Streptomyces lavendulae]
MIALPANQAVLHVSWPSEISVVEPTGYICQAVAAGSIYGKSPSSYELSKFNTISPRLALQWLRCEALHIANGLDPDPAIADWNLGVRTCEAEPVLDAPTVLRGWAGDSTTQASALRDLKDGRPLFLVAQDADFCYTLSVCPFGNVLLAGCPVIESRRP